MKNKGKLIDYFIGLILIIDIYFLFNNNIINKPTNYFKAIIPLIVFFAIIAYLIIKAKKKNNVSLKEKIEVKYKNKYIEFFSTVMLVGSILIGLNKLQERDYLSSSVAFIVLIISYYIKDKNEIVINEKMRE